MSKQVVWLQGYRIVPVPGSQQERAKHIIGTERIKLTRDDIGITATFTNDAGNVDEYFYEYDAVDCCVNVPRAGKK